MRCIPLECETKSTFESNDGFPCAKKGTSCMFSEILLTLKIPTMFDVVRQTLKYPSQQPCSSEQIGVCRWRWFFHGLRTDCQDNLQLKVCQSQLRKHHFKSGSENCSGPQERSNRMTGRIKSSKVSRAKRHQGYTAIGRRPA